MVTFVMILLLISTVIGMMGVKDATGKVIVVTMALAIILFGGVMGFGFWALYDQPAMKAATSTGLPSSFFKEMLEDRSVGFLGVLLQFPLLVLLDVIRVYFWIIFCPFKALFTGQGGIGGIIAMWIPVGITIWYVSVNALYHFATNDD